MKNKSISVYQLNKYVKTILENDFLLNDLSVEGEISNFKAHSSGHMYFTLKDNIASVNCVLFKNDSFYLDFEPKNGTKVVAYGNISIYEKTGQYQFYIKSLTDYGSGTIQLSFEELKQRLYVEGLFDEIYKKPIPSYPKVIGIITSPTGAAIQDIISVFKRKNKSVSLVIYPITVQGKNAKNEICKAIKILNLWNKCDVILISRGGGSYDDLQPFNDEKVAYDIFKSKIPIVSAIGHEIDFTISDFVSDLRVPTPSIGAELLIPDLNEMNNYIYELKNKLDKSIDNILSIKKQELNIFCESMSIEDKLNEFNLKKNDLNNIIKQIFLKLDFKISMTKTKLLHHIALLEKSSPTSMLKKGFVIIKDGNNNYIKTVEEIKEGQVVKLSFQDGVAEAIIRSVYNG